MYANPACPAGCPGDLLGLRHGPHRVGCRLVMILLSQHGTGGLGERARSGRPRLGSPRLGQRIRRLLGQPKAWTIGRLWQQLGRPTISRRTLHRRVREVACWRRPRLVARGDPDRDQILTDLHQHIRDLPTGAVLWAEDEAHSNLLPWVRATWILRGQRQQVMTPGPTGAAPSSAPSTLPRVASCIR